VKPVKRIEIVVGMPELEALLELLGRARIDAYTVMRNVGGKGQRGLRSDDELSDVFRNACVVLACAPADVSRVVEAVRPLLARHGGMCLVSDAEWLLH